MMAEHIKFQTPEFNNFDSDDDGFVIRSDIPTKPFTESSLRKKIGEKTKLRGLIESYGNRDKKDKDRGGWYLAAGAIVVTAAGVEYFRSRHGKESEKA